MDEQAWASFRKCTITDGDGGFPLIDTESTILANLGKTEGLPGATI